MLRGRVQVFGTEDLRKRLKQLGKDADKALGKSLYLEGEEIMAQSKAGFVPRDTSALASSGHVQLPLPGPLVLLGFGGPAVKYAVVQHEGHFRHPVGQRKYLEIPMMAAIPGMPKRIGRDLDKWLKTRAIKKKTKKGTK